MLYIPYCVSCIAARNLTSHYCFPRDLCLNETLKCYQPPFSTCLDDDKPIQEATMGASQTNLRKTVVGFPSASSDSQAHRQIPKRIARFPSASSDSQAGLQRLYGHRQSTLELEICGCLLRRQVFLIFFVKFSYIKNQ